MKNNKHPIILKIAIHFAIILVVALLCLWAGGKIQEAKYEESNQSVVETVDETVEGATADLVETETTTSVNEEDSAAAEDVPSVIMEITETELVEFGVEPEPTTPIEPPVEPTVEPAGVEDPVTDDVNNVDGAAADDVLTYSTATPTTDLEMLACVIYREVGADFCCDECRYRVGDVVLNRVESDLFPDTIYGVLTQPGQYGPFIYGLSWGPNASNECERHAVERAYHIAQDLLNGNHSELYGNGYIWQAGFGQGTDGFRCDNCRVYYGR